MRFPRALVGLVLRLDMRPVTSTKSRQPVEVPGLVNADNGKQLAGQGGAALWGFSLAETRVSGGRGVWVPPSTVAGIAGALGIPR